MMKVACAMAMTLGLSAVGMGQVMVQSGTTAADSLNALINVTAGRPSMEAFSKYGGDLDAYWRVVETQRSGKAFEACIAWQENARFRALGDGRQILVLAAEGQPQGAADLRIVDHAGRTLHEVQCKLGWDGAKAALTDPKYAGMQIMTPADQLGILQGKLAKAEQVAGARGKQLPQEWKTVREAVDSGRLAVRTPSGTPLPTRSDVMAASRQSLEAAWKDLAEIASSKGLIVVRSVGEGAISKSVGDGAGGSGEAAAKAATAADRATVSVADDVAQGIRAEGAAKALGKVVETASKVAVPVAVGVDAGFRVHEAISPTFALSKGKDRWR